MEKEIRQSWYAETNTILTPSNINRKKLLLLHIIVKYFPKTNYCSKIDLRKELVLVELSREVSTSKLFNN